MTSYIMNIISNATRLTVANCREFPVLVLRVYARDQRIVHYGSILMDSEDNENVRFGKSDSMIEVSFAFSLAAKFQ